MEQYKLGRRPPKNMRALNFSQFYSGVVPDYPLVQDNLAVLTNWNLLGNDRYGDCFIVSCANYVRLVTHAIGAEIYPTLDDVLQAYKWQNPQFDPNTDADDNGCDMQTGLELWHANGWAGTKLIAFSKIDSPATHLDLVDAAISIFGGVLLGVNVQSQNEAEFNAGAAWTYDPNGADEGGHAILAGGFGILVTNLLSFISWAQEAHFTAEFIQHLLQECWLPILDAHLKTPQFQQGVDWAKLNAAYTAITNGKTITV